MARATLRLEFGSAAEARNVALALEPDHEGHLRSRLEGPLLVLEAESDSMMGILRSLDDALGCVRAAGEP
ncbi:MAG TPA: KEOPS complex subunit Pcc1 [Candidatus Thermoplasmatota archaeon]|nr:KEOPS complex subunit Pcc1 [Candidatus Thermoplasmatota archaeon]